MGRPPGGKLKQLWQFNLEKEEAAKGGVVPKQTPPGLLSGLPKVSRSIPKKKDPLSKSARNPIEKIEQICPTCAGIGNIPINAKGKLKKQKFRQKNRRETNKNADVVRGLCGFQPVKGIVREVPTYVQPYNGKFGIQLWLELICHGLDPRDLSYSRFPTSEQLQQKLHWKKVLKALAKAKDPKAKEKAALIWKVQPCNKDGSWTHKGLGCEILHKPTGLTAAAISSTFWQSRATAERQLAIKLGIFEPKKLYYDQTSLAGEPAHKRMFLALIPPWQESPYFMDDWPYDWWPVTPSPKKSKT